MKHSGFVVGITWCCLLALVAGLLGCAPAVTPTPTPEPTATPAPSPTPEPTPVPEGPEVTINLVAENVAFDKKTITVPPNARVTIVFTNNDSPSAHNFALYETPAAAKSIFVGEYIDGLSQKTITYRFTAPSSPGTYFFRCNVHPTLMTGEFIVKANGL